LEYTTFKFEITTVYVLKHIKFFYPLKRTFFKLSNSPTNWIHSYKFPSTERKRNEYQQLVAVMLHIQTYCWKAIHLT